MSKFKEYLTDQQQKDLILSRLAQLAQSGYMLEVDLEIYQSLGDIDSANAILQQIEVVENGISLCKSRLSEI